MTKIGRWHTARVLALVLGAALAGSSGPARAQSLPASDWAANTIRCQQAVVTAGARVLARRLRVLEICAGNALACVQTKANDSGCLPRVAERCRRALAAYATRDVPAVGATLGRRCGRLPFADVLAADGLGYGRVVTECSESEGIAVTDVASLAQCLVAQHGAAADRLFAARLPRAGELVAVAGVSLGASSALPDFGGSGLGLGDGRGKVVKRCAAAIRSAASRLVGAELRGLERCGRAVYACVQTASAVGGIGKPAKVAATDCLPQAAAVCEGELARMASATGALRATVTKRCGAAMIPFATLRAANAANLDALDEECARYGVPALGTLDDYVTCLTRQHSCRSQDLLVREVPRARELAAYAGRSVPSAECASGGTAGLESVQSVVHDATAGNGLNGPRAVVVSPDGAQVYVASYDDDSLAAFRRDPSNGTLVPIAVLFDGVGGVDGLNGPRGLTMSPDGAHVYVAGSRDDAVAVFARNAATGALTFVERKKNGVGVLESLNGARAVAVSPDGAHVYVAADPADAVAVFTRDPATGSLTFVARAKNGEAGVSGLHGPYALTVAPDGTSLYVTAFDDDAVVVFARDVATGALTFVEREKDGENGARALDGARALAVDPSGAYVYVAGELARAVAIFARDPVTGALTPSAVRRHVLGAPDGLQRPDAVIVSADGERVFTISGYDNVVAQFDREAETGGIALAASTTLGIGPLGGEPGVLALALAPDGAHLYALQSTRDVLEVVAVAK